MTQAPPYPHVHAYDGENPFDIVDSAWGSIERWRAQALQTGELGALTDLSKQVRSDSVAISARQDERERDLIERGHRLDARERELGVAIAKFHESVVGRADSIATRLEKAKADAEEGPLPLPPGEPSGSSKNPDPPLGIEGDAVPPAHGDPPGDPLTPEQQEREFAGNLRLSRPITSDQDDPPAGGVEFPDPELPHPPVQQQPIAAGLDEE